MSQKISVIASRVVSALVRSARLGAMQRGLHDGGAHIEHEAELQCRQQLSIERKAAVLQFDVVESLSTLTQLVGCFLERTLIAINARAIFHRLVHLRTDGGEALTASGLAQELFLKTAFLIIRRRDDVFAERLLLNRRQSRGSAGPDAKDEKLRQRVGTEAVGAVDAYARHLSRRVQARQRRRAIVVRAYPAHHVMNDRPHRYEFPDGINVLVFQAQLAHKRQPSVDHFFAHVAKIKMDDWSVWSSRRA